MKLAAKLMLVFLAAVMLLTAVGSYFSVRRAFERFAQRQEQLAHEAAGSLDQQLAAAWSDGGPEGLLAALSTISPPDRQVAMRWVWFEQTQLTPHTVSTTIIQQHGLGPGRMVSIAAEDDTGHRRLHTYYPIELREGPLGGLEFIGSLDPLDAEARETITMALVTLGVMSAVALGLVYIAGVQWVARPLDRLIDKTKRIGRGDFSEPLDTRGHDELSQLARALNDMAAQLANLQQRIHDESAERLATLEQLRHADRLKTVGRLAAGLAHELGTPLNVVSGRAGLIASGQLSADEVTHSAQAIKGEVERITAIIRQLLDFARQRTPQRSSVDMVEVVRETTTLLAPIAEKHRVRIQLPSDAQMQPARVDRAQLQQVLTNVFVNAMQAMPDGGDINVTFATEWLRQPHAAEAQVDEYLTIAITDQGTGIPAENIAQIFEPFFTTKDVGDGTGLGLSIAYGILQEHGGWVDVTSEVGRGSCFSIHLPRE